MRYVLALALSIFLSSMAFADDYVNIGFNIGTYPRLVPVRGYPVYYDPRINENYFFYDGLYWVYYNDNWYQSGWYNGPWQLVEPVYVPVYVLRVPVRYYRRPPVFFRPWPADGPPHWNEHWGHEWEQRRSDWNQWNRDVRVVPAPLPTYQRKYSGARYPVRSEQQQVIRSEKYRYEPHEAFTQQHWQQPSGAHNAAHADRAQRGNGHGNPHQGDDGNGNG